MGGVRRRTIRIRLVAGVSVVLAVALTGLMGWMANEQRSIAIGQAKEFALGMHRMTLAGLTGMMITGTIAQRAVFLDQVRSSEEIRELRVIRAEAVVRQFGQGTAEEMRSDPIELAVMESRQPSFEIGRDADGESLRAAIPVIAQANYLGKNCLGCHAVSEGTVLGVVTVRVPLDKVNASVAHFRSYAAIAALTVLLVVIGLIWYSVTRSVTAPLSELARGLNDIADGDGDLTRRLSHRGDDEVADVAKAFNRFMEKLLDIVGEVRGSAERLRCTAAELVQSSNQVVSNSLEQSRQASSVAVQVETMSRTLDDLVSQALEVQRISAESGRCACEGAEIIHAAVEEINRIIETVNQSAEIIQDLSRQSDQITTIVGVIREIAERTNLLALNAAIEAARAGAQGRGFSIVAHEIRELAERTRASTLAISTMVEQTQSGTQRAALTMAAGAKGIDAGTVLAGKAGEAITRIKVDVGRVVSAVDWMSAALREQADSNDQSATKVEIIARLSKENCREFRENAQVLLHLNDLALNLGDLVGRFKI